MLLDTRRDIKDKNKKSERVLVLEVIDGKAPISTSGLLDHRLFNGGNSVYAIQGPSGTLWSLRYKVGILPEPLRQQFTGFDKLLKYAREYFKKRNLNIKEVLD